MVMNVASLNLSFRRALPWEQIGGTPVHDSLSGVFTNFNEQVSV